MPVTDEAERTAVRSAGSGEHGIGILHAIVLFGRIVALAISFTAPSAASLSSSQSSQANL
jgi:hypothetical protein